MRMRVGKHEREEIRQEVKKTESEFVANGDIEKREERKRATEPTKLGNHDTCIT